MTAPIAVLKFVFERNKFKDKLTHYQEPNSEVERNKHIQSTERVESHVESSSINSICVSLHGLRQYRRLAVVRNGSIFAEIQRVKFLTRNKS